MRASGKETVAVGGALNSRGWRATLIILCLALPLMATPSRLAQEAGAKTDETPLALRLSVYEQRVCLGSSFTLSLEAENTGRQELKIYKPGLWSHFSYSAVGSNIAGSSISCGPGGDGPENWAVVEPGAKFYDTLTYHTEWNEFFKSVGNYRISTSVAYQVSGDKSAQSVSSSEAEFEIYDCGAK